MANLLEHLQKLCSPYEASVELIDFPIGEEGYIAVVSSSKVLSPEEMRELGALLTKASLQIRRVVIDITPSHSST